MRTRILQCTSKAAASPSAEALALLPNQLAEFAAELEVFEARLPISFRETEANFRLRSYSTRLGIFIMTHVVWRLCHLDLYRLFLPGLREALPAAALQQLDPHFVLHNRSSCYEHARAMADMFSQLLSLSGTASSPPVADLDLPGCAFQCSRVLYHGLQTDGGNLGFTQERVRELATVCLRAARQSTPGLASASMVRLVLTPQNHELTRAKALTKWHSKRTLNGSLPTGCRCPRSRLRCRAAPAASPPGLTRRSLHPRSRRRIIWSSRPPQPGRTRRTPDRPRCRSPPPRR
jgi:hypothetical protein